MGICLSHNTALDYLRASDNLAGRKATWDPARDSAARFKPTHAQIRALLGGAPGFEVCEGVIQSDKPVHIMVPTVGSRIEFADKSRIVQHLCKCGLPHQSVIQMKRELFVGMPELVFIQMAAGFSFPEMVSLGFELCGTYRIQKGSTRGFRDAIPVTNVFALQGYLQRAQRLRGVQMARQAAQYVVAGSASPRETALALILCLPTHYGGYGLPFPQMNFEVKAGRHSHGQPGGKVFRCDLFWADKNLAVEYNSDMHHTGAFHIANDASRQNMLMYQGIHVLPVTNLQMRNANELDRIADTLARHLGVRLRIRKPDWRSAQMKLLSKVLTYSGYWD